MKNRPNVEQPQKHNTRGNSRAKMYVLSECSQKKIKTIFWAKYSGESSKWLKRKTPLLKTDFVLTKIIFWGRKQIVWPDKWELCFWKKKKRFPFFWKFFFEKKFLQIFYGVKIRWRVVKFWNKFPKKRKISFFKKTKLLFIRVKCFFSKNNLFLSNQNVG